MRTLRLTNKRLRVILLATLASCGREAREADPYAARMATVQAPYVRHANTVAATAIVDSVADPQFTKVQAQSGAEVYGKVCARCHAMTQWSGGTFSAGWQDRRLSSFYDLVSTTMPQDAPGTLTPDQYVNVTAYVLELAGFPSGPVALRGDTSMLRHARLAIKTKPAS
ncbi:MAG: cytochrome c [bacterium]